MPNKPTRRASAIAFGMALLGLGSAAHADGISGPAPRAYAPPPPPPPLLTWAGFYVGANIGGAWATGTLTDDSTGTSFDTDHSGFIGGGQVGYNYQTGNMVLGVEWDFDWTSISDDGSVTLLGTTLQASADTDWVTTLAGRVGLVSDQWMVFVKLGGAWVRNSASVTNLTTGAAVSASDTRGGWVVGGGAEYLLAPHWTAKIEYDFVGLSDRTATGPLGNTVTFERDLQILKVGLNYKF